MLDSEPGRTTPQQQTRWMINPVRLSISLNERSYFNRIRELSVYANAAQPHWAAESGRGVRVLSC